MLPFDNLIVTVPNITPQKFKDLMEWGVAARTPDANGNGKFPQISGFKIVVSGISTTATAQTQSGRRSPSRARASSRSRSTTERRSSRTAPSSPARRTSPWPRRTSRPTTVTPTRSASRSCSPQIPYQQSLFDYIKTDLGGVVTAAKYPVGGSGRITINP